MPQPRYASPLDDALRALRSLGVAPAVANALAGGDIVQAIERQVLADIEAFSMSGNPDTRPELQRHLHDLVVDAIARLSGAGDDALTFVRSYASRRAEQRFPLEATLQVYRSAQRILTESIRDAALQIADQDAQLRRVVAATTDFAIEYTHQISTAATSAYVEATRQLAEAESDRRSELLSVLLRGYDESDSRTALLLRNAGYLEQRQSFCVVVARSANPREMDSAPRAQRMVESIMQVLRPARVRTLAGVRDGLATFVLSATRRLSGWTAPQSALADRVLPRLKSIGPAALIGVSNDAPSTSHLRRAGAEAKLALDFCSVANRVIAYADIPFRQMIVHHARDRVRSTLPVWLERFRAADRKSQGKLSATLQGYAAANMNALQTAKALSLHANTIYARMQKISDLTGLNPLTFNDLMEMLLVLETSQDHAGTNIH